MSTNGLLSFRESFNEFRVSQFPRVSSDAVPIIAPLWADYNFRQRGNLYYRITENDATLARARQLIAKGNKAGFNEFLPSRCVVVTWVNAVLFARMLDDIEVCYFSPFTIIWQPGHMPCVS